MTRYLRGTLLCSAVCTLLPYTTAAVPRVLFEENRGQTASEVRYLARAHGQTIYFTDRDVAIELDGPDRSSFVVRLSFPGSAVSAAWEHTNQCDNVSYFVGSDASKWVRNAPLFSKLTRRAIYPGVDAVFYADGSRLEYDLVLAPGADPSLVRLRFGGGWQVAATPDGDIEVTTPAGVLRQRVPAIYQESGTGRTRVDGRFVKAGRNEFRLQLGSYAKNRTLVVDPVLSYSSYLGGEADDQVVVAGDTFVAGTTASIEFPGAAGTRRRTRDIFLRGLSGTSNVPAFFGTVVLGGSGDDELTAAVRNTRSGRAVFLLAGASNSRDFPSGSSTPVSFRGGTADGFIVLYEPGTGFPTFSTVFIGGSGEDRITAVAPASVSLYFAGETDSSDLPVLRASQPYLAGGKDAFLGLANAVGVPAPFSLTYLGGTGDDSAYAVTADLRGRIYVGGETRSPDFPLAGALQGERKGPSDAFLTRMQYVGGSFQLDESRLIGGSGEDRIQALAVRPATFFFTRQILAAAGTTWSDDFPLVSPMQDSLAGDSDAFVLKIDADEGTLLYSTYLGGSGADEGLAVAVNSEDDISVAGSTRSIDLQVYQALQPQSGGGQDGFLAVIEHTNRLRQFTYFGGDGDDVILGVATASDNSTQVVGRTDSSNLPLGESSERNSKDGRTDGFIANIGTAYLIGPDRLSLGQDLAIAIQLRAAQPATRIPLTLRSSDPSKLRFEIEGRSREEVTLIGNWAVNIEAFADSGSVDIVATAPGFEPKTIKVTLLPTVAIPYPLPLRLTTWSLPVSLGYSLSGYNAETNTPEGPGSPRKGLESIRARWSIADENVAQIVSGSDTQSPTFSVVPRNAGTTALMLETDRFRAWSPQPMEITVRRPAVTPFGVTLGKDLQSQVPYSIEPTLARSSFTPRGAITFRSSDPTRLLLSARSDQPAEASVTIEAINQGFFPPPVFMHALANEGVVRVLISSQEFETDKEVAVSLSDAVLTPFVASATPQQITMNPGWTTEIRLHLGPPTTNVFAAGAILRPGVTPVQLRLGTSDASVATVTPSTMVLGASGATPSVRAVGPGVAEISVTSDSPNLRVEGKLRITVQAPTSALQLRDVEVGKDLQALAQVRATTISIPENTEVTLSIDDPALAVLSPDAVTVGRGEIPGACA